MMKLVFKLYILLISVYSFSQARITGNVYLQNSGWTPVEGIKINAEEGAIRDYSTASGEFNLKFPMLKPGDVIYPSIGDGNKTAVDKNGSVFELVNEIELRAIALPNDPEKTPINIIVCHKGARHKAAITYYNILDEETTKQIRLKERELILVKQKLGVSKDSIKKLQLSLENYKRFNDSISLFKEANYFAGINRDEASGRIIKFLNSLLAKKSIEEARKELNTSKALKEAELGYKSLNSSIEEININAKVLISQFKIEEAISQLDTLELIINKKNLHPILRFDNYINKAVLKSSLSRSDKALKDLEQAEKILLTELNPDKLKDKLLTLNDTYGFLYLASYQMDKAQIYIDKNKSLFESMDENQKKKFSSFYSNSLTHLGLISFNKDDLFEAEKLFKEAKAINTKIKNPSNQEIMLLGTIEHNLGAINKLNKSHDAALEHLNEAVINYSVYREKSGDMSIDQMISQVLKVMGVINMEQKDYVQSEELLNESINLLQKINIGDQIYNEELGTAYRELGTLFVAQNRDTTARINYQKSIDLLKPLCTKSEYACFDMATVLYCLGDIEIDDQKAIKIYLQALEIFDDLKSQWVIDKVHEAHARGGLAKRYFEIEAYEKSREAFYNTLSFYTKDIEFIKKYSNGLMNILMYLGEIEYKLKNYDEAIVQFDQALEVNEKFIKSKNSEQYKTFLEDINRHLGDVYTAQENYEQAEKAYLKLNKELKNILDTNTSYGQLLPFYSLKLDLGVTQMELGKFDEAETNYLEAIKIKEKMISLLRKTSSKPIKLTIASEYGILADLMEVQLMLNKDLTCISRGNKYIDLGFAILENNKYLFEQHSNLIASLESTRAYLEYYQKANSLYNVLLTDIVGIEAQIENVQNHEEKLAFQKEIVKKLENYVDVYPDFDTSKANLSIHYGNAAWYSLFDNKFEDSQEFAEMGLKTDSTQVWINTNLVLSYVLQNQLEKAKTIYNELWYEIYTEDEETYKDVFTNDINTLVENGITHEDFNEVKELLNNLEINNKLNIETAKQKNDLALSYLKSKNYDLAIDNLLASVELYNKIRPKPFEDLVKSYRYLASAYTKIRAFDKALESQLLSQDFVENAISADDNELIVSHAYTASAFRNAKKPKEALPHSEYVVKLVKSLYGNTNDLLLATAYYKLATNHFDLGNYYDAIPFHKDALRIREANLNDSDSDLLKSYYNLALAQFQVSKYKDALDNFKKVVAFNKSYDLYNRMGLCYYYLKDYKSAIQDYLTAASMSKEYSETLFQNNIGTAYVKDLQFDKASKAFKELEVAYPNSGRVYRNWAMYYALKGDIDDAILNLQKAIKLGYNDFKWLQSDESLNGLRSDHRFKAIINQFKE